MYGQYYGYALKIVFRYVHRYETAVDIVNDGFVKVFKNIEKFEYTSEADLEKMLMGWMRSIMVNSSIDELRKKGMVFEIGGIPNYVWEEADKSGNADQKLLYKELMIQVKKLPPVYRVVFNMFAIDGFQHHEIAAALGISVGTSKSNLSKARALLQKFIKEQEAVSVWAI